jgi:hypothetical protein
MRRVPLYSSGDAHLVKVGKELRIGARKTDLEGASRRGRNREYGYLASRTNKNETARGGSKAKANAKVAKVARHPLLGDDDGADAYPDCAHLDNCAAYDAVVSALGWHFNVRVFAAGWGRLRELKSISCDPELESASGYSLFNP